MAQERPQVKNAIVIQYLIENELIWDFERLYKPRNWKLNLGTYAWAISGESQSIGLVTFIYGPIWILWTYSELSLTTLPSLYYTSLRHLYSMGKQNWSLLCIQKGSIFYIPFSSNENFDYLINLNISYFNNN